MPREQSEFVSEPLVPIKGTSDTSGMSRGEPGVPQSFVFRKQRYDVLTILSRWKTGTRDRGEMYLRRHWCELALTDGSKMTIYCERQTKNRAKPKSRWWVYSIGRGKG